MSEIEMEERKEKRRQDVEMFKATITAGQAAIKSAILINGGAAVALLAFTGHAFTNLQDSEVTAKLTHAMTYFVWGVISGAVASGVVYLALWVGSRDKRKIAHTLNGFSWFLIICCYTVFAVGAFKTFKVF